MRFIKASDQSEAFFVYSSFVATGSATDYKSEALEVMKDSRFLVALEMTEIVQLLLRQRFSSSNCRVPLLS